MAAKLELKLSVNRLVVKFPVSNLRTRSKQFRAWFQQKFPWIVRIGVWAAKTLLKFIRSAKWLLGTMWLAAGGYYLLNELRGTLSTPDADVFSSAQAILLTLAAWVGVPFLVWRTLLANEQTKINRESNYTDRFTKAVETLGATRIDNDGNHLPVIESRIGAIYALERLAKDSESDYGPVIETLSAYVREQCGEPSVFSFDGLDPEGAGISTQEKANRLYTWCTDLWAWCNELKMDPPSRRPDVVAALTVLGRRKERRHWHTKTSTETQPRLHGANLQGADLSEMTETFVHDQTGIAQACIDGIDLSGSKLENSTVVGPRIHYEFQFEKVVPRELIGASLIGLRLLDEEFFPVLNGANVSYADMEDSACKDAKFIGTRMIRADFRNATVRNAKFGFANCSFAKFNGAFLTHGEFIGTYLEGAEFIGADLSHAVFFGNTVQETRFDGSLLIDADFSGVKSVTTGMLAEAFGTKGTLLPVGVSRPNHWSDDATAIARWKGFRRMQGMPVTNSE